METSVWFDTELGIFVSHCPVLDLYSQGETEEEAKQAIEESILLFLKYRFMCFE